MRRHIEPRKLGPNMHERKMEMQHTMLHARIKLRLLPPQTCMVVVSGTDNAHILPGSDQAS